MAGTIVVDRIESDASYASSINIASPIQISNTITGNVNFDSGTLFVDAVNNRVGIGTQNPVVGLQVTNSSGGGQIRVVSSGGNILQLISDSSEASIRAVAAVPLTFRTSNEERMAIDASGRVTKPYQPWFRAYTDDQQTIPNNGSDYTVTYDNTYSNNGSHYNTTNSRFTAPVAGWYHFNAFFMLNSFPTDWGYCFIRFVINGSSNSEIMYPRPVSGSQFVTLQASTYVYMNVNDYVEVNARQSGGGSNSTIRGAFGEFQGMLVA